MVVDLLPWHVIVFILRKEWEMNYSYLIQYALFARERSDCFMRICFLNFSGTRRSFEGVD